MILFMPSKLDFTFLCQFLDILFFAKILVGNNKIVTQTLGDTFVASNKWYWVKDPRVNEHDRQLNWK